MSRFIRARVFRWDPDQGTAPRYDAYDVPADAPLSVLAILDYIYTHLDSTLAYRHCRFHLGVCTSCLVMVDGSKERAFARLVNPGAEVTIAPPGRSLVVRDLVVRARGEGRR